MPCTRVTLPDGVTAIVCGPRQRPKRCACGSGLTADLLCDWKVDQGTCDAQICAACSTKPAPDKDLCATHARAWVDWKTVRQRSNSAGPPDGT